MAYYDDTYFSGTPEAKKPAPGVESFPFSTDRLPYEKHIKREKKQKERKGGFWKKALWLFVTVGLVAGGCLCTGYYFNEYWSTRYTALNITMQESLAVMQEQLDQFLAEHKTSVDDTQDADGSLTPGQIYTKTVNSVVGIYAVSDESFFGNVMQTESSGSGFVLSEDGYIVSNYHVVQDSVEITVVTADDVQYDAQIIGFDATNDIAVLKIEATGLTPATVGSSDETAVGDRVCAIGNPLGEFTSTLTVGYISAKDRIVTTDGTTLNMMQTDAAINPGNSGGPLFNMQGEVIGITTAKHSGISDSGATIEGIGFAIPMDDVIGMIEDLRDYGYVTGAYMGVLAGNVDSKALIYGIPEGAFIQEVYPDTAAQKAGIQEKDIVVNLGGYEVGNITELSLALRKFKAGDTVSVTVFRGGQLVNMTIVLDEKPIE